MTSETLHSDQAATPSPEPLLQMIQGLEVTAILQAGVQLRVFDHVADGKIRSTAIAAAIDADERGTRILLDALAALRLLERDDGTYHLSPMADAFLVTGRPTYMGGLLDIFAPDWVWTSHQRLAEVVRSGGTLLEQHAETPGHTFWETFAPSSTALAVPGGQPSPTLSGNGVLSARTWRSRRRRHTPLTGCRASSWSPAVATPPGSVEGPVP